MTAASGSRSLPGTMVSRGFNDMNAPAGDDGRHGWFVGEVSALLVCLMVVAFGPAVARGEQVTLPDGSVVVGDGFDGFAGSTPVEEPAGAMMTLPFLGQVGTGSGRGCCPRWDLAVDALMLWQGNAQSLPLILDANGATVLDARQLGTEMAAGPRGSLIRKIGECHAIEANYFQVRPFNASAVAPAGGGPYQLANMGDIYFNDIESATVTSSGWIQSAELNWRKSTSYSPITWIAGFRWVELNSQCHVDYAFTNPDPFGSGFVNAASGNNLYGGQMGADMRLWNRGGSWLVNGIGKAGVFYNRAAYQNSTAGFIPVGGNPYLLDPVAAIADQTAFFGEVGVNSTYWLTPWLAWRAGYSFFWASGVAVAAQQLPLNNFGEGTTSINTNGSVLLHGVTTGVEARW